MKYKNQLRPIDLPNPSAAGFLRGLSELLWAYDYAQDAGVDVWDFALEIDELRRVGMTINDMRWLLVKGFAEHGQETSVYGDEHRSFRAGKGLTFVARSSLVLSTTGAAFARKTLAAARDAEANAEATNTAPARDTAKRNLAPRRRW